MQGVVFGVKALGLGLGYLGFRVSGFRVWVVGLWI